MVLSVGCREIPNLVPQALSPTCCFSDLDVYRAVSRSFFFPLLLFLFDGFCPSLNVFLQRGHHLGCWAQLCPVEGWLVGASWNWLCPAQGSPGCSSQRPHCSPSCQHLGTCPCYSAITAASSALLNPFSLNCLCRAPPWEVIAVGRPVRREKIVSVSPVLLNIKSLDKYYELAEFSACPSPGCLGFGHLNRLIKYHVFTSLACYLLPCEADELW